MKGGRRKRGEEIGHGRGRFDPRHKFWLWPCSFYRPNELMFYDVFI